MTEEKVENLEDALETLRTLKNLIEHGLSQDHLFITLFIKSFIDYA